MDEPTAEVLPDGCPDIPQFRFDVVVHEPDPNAQRLSDQKNGSVVAVCDGVIAGELLYGYVGDEIWLTRVRTEPDFRCRGAAKQMIEALIAHFPDNQVKDGGGSNSGAGDAMLSRLRDQRILSDG